MKLWRVNVEQVYSVDYYVVADSQVEAKEIGERDFDRHDCLDMEPKAEAFDVKPERMKKAALREVVLGLDEYSPEITVEEFLRDAGNRCPHWVAFTEQCAECAEDAGRLRLPEHLPSTATRGIDVAGAI